MLTICTKLKSFDLQLFGKGSVKTTNIGANVYGGNSNMDTTGNQQNTYAQLMGQGATSAANASNAAISDVPSINWNAVNNTEQSGLAAINSKATDLTNGILPSSYLTNETNYLNSGLQNTMGKYMSDLAGKGIVNSSVMGSDANSENNAVSTALAGNYTSDLSTENSLLNSSLADTEARATTQAANQSSALAVPTAFSALANTDDAANSTLYNNYLTQQTALSSPASTTVTQSPGFLSSAASAYTAALCFVAGTKIATPEAAVPIENVKVGDKVLSFDNDRNVIEEEVTWIQEPHVSPNQYIEIITSNGSTITTAHQPFLVDTDRGEMFYTADELTLDDKLVHISNSLYIHDIIFIDDKELVYDLTVTGRNIYFANGLAVEGRKQ